MQYVLTNGCYVFAQGFLTGASSYLYLTDRFGFGKVRTARDATPITLGLISTLQRS